MIILLLAKLKIGQSCWRWGILDIQEQAIQGLEGTVAFKAEIGSKV